MDIKRLLLAVVILCLPINAIAAVSAKDMEKAFASGQTAYKEGRLDDAATSFTSAAEALVALKQQDKARAVYNNVAIVRMKQERWQDAYDVYVKLFSLQGKLDPAFHIKAVGNMAFCAEKAQRHDLKAEAIATLLASKTKIAPPDLLNFLAMQGDAYRASERYALACQSYEKALAMKDVPEDKKGTLLTGLGLAQGNLGRYPKALESLTAALKSATDTKQQMAIVEATSNIGIIYWEMGQYEKAAQTLKDALVYAKDFKLRRNEGVDNNNMGLVYKSAGQLKDAISHIDLAIDIAREVENLRDEAIALSNRALLFRMNGENKIARENYAKALEMYRKVTFTEGEASTLMGLAKMDVVVDKNYEAALEKLNAAVAIYEKLENPGFLAEAYVQLGQLYQKIATPNRKTRDLVFEDEEPKATDLSPEDALAKSKEFYSKAKPLAEVTGRKEMIWSALHGLGFVEREANSLKAAFDHYSQAIDVVLSMKGSEENPDLLIEFLRNKDDLFAEAIDVCTRLYEQEKDPAMLRKQMEYDEIYNNEVVRAHGKMAALSYAEPEKKALYDEVIQLTSTKKKAEAATRNAAKAENPTAKAEQKIVTEDASLAEKEFEAKLKLWKSRYPNDAVLFDSTASVNLDDLRSKLTPDQAIVQYIPLEDSLIILTATNEEVAMTRVAIAYDKLASLVRDRMLAENVEGMTRIDLGKPGQKEKEDQLYKDMFEIFGTLYTYLYGPVAEKLKDKTHLYLVTSKFLSYVPYAALITGTHEDGSPKFLVEEKILSLNRLSFLADLDPKEAKKTLSRTDIIAVGNPSHSVLKQASLDGAESEAQNAVNAMKNINPETKATVLLTSEATESAWIKAASETPYSVMYFATHGVPFAETMFFENRVRETSEKSKNEKTKERAKDTLEFIKKAFPNKSHLYAYLYMTYPDEGYSGTLTLKKILELPESVFSNANLAVLSACNSAVTYSPKVLHDKDAQTELENSEAREALVEAGWTPGLDQVCLMDSFMKRNFRNVYGNLWAADDTASAYIMKAFLDNLKEHPTAAAYREAQLDFLRNPPKALTYTQYPKHPTYWACGNIFGQ